MSKYAKEFLAVHFAFDTFAHILWESTKPVLMLIDNKNLTRFFQAKTIPSSLWSCVDHVLNFKFVLGHIPGEANAAADYLSRTHINPHTKIQMRFNSKLPFRKVKLEVRLDCEIFLTPHDLRKYCPELNAVDEHNPLDSFDLTDKQNP